MEPHCPPPQCPLLADLVVCALQRCALGARALRTRPRTQGALGRLILPVRQRISWLTSHICSTSSSLFHAVIPVAHITHVPSWSGRLRGGTAKHITQQRLRPYFRAAIIARVRHVNFTGISKHIVNLIQTPSEERWRVTARGHVPPPRTRSLALSCRARRAINTL